MSLFRQTSTTIASTSNGEIIRILRLLNEKDVFQEGVRLFYFDILTAWKIIIAYCCLHDSSKNSYTP